MNPGPRPQHSGREEIPVQDHGPGHSHPGAGQRVRIRGREAVGGRKKCLLSLSSLYIPPALSPPENEAGGGF